MNKLPYATALLSVVIAVSLFLIASWLEGDPPWLVPRPEGGNHFTNAPVTPETPARTAPRESGCDDAEETLRVKVENAQHCSTDDDCTLFDYGYPIQCLTSVAKSEITALRLEYRNYEQSCAFRVYYDCPTGNMERQAVCRDRRCSVVLESTDVLEDKTLDYLGIDP